MIPEKRPITTASDNSASRAVRDEWGIYDPEQAGVEAVFRRLAEKATRINSTAASAADSK